HGVAGYVINGNSNQQGQFGGNYNMNGVTGMGYCTAINTNCEGTVSYALDNAALSGVTLVDFEAGMFPQNTTDQAIGFLFSPFGTVQPTFMPAFFLHNNIGGLSTNTILATVGLDCGTQSLTVQNTSFSNCIQLNPINTGNNQVSSSINFNGTSSTGTTLDSYLTEFADAASATPRLGFSGHNGGSAASFTAPAFIMTGLTTPVSGCSLSAQGGGIAGHFVSGVAGTCTVTLTMPVTTFTGWACTARDLTTPADVMQQTAYTTTTATFSGTTASGDNVAYNCVGF